MISDYLHDADVLSRHHDSHRESEGLDDFWPPDVIEDQETI